jgi:hypothetical protein
MRGWRALVKRFFFLPDPKPSGSTWKNDNDKPKFKLSLQNLEQLWLHAPRADLIYIPKTLLFIYNLPYYKVNTNSFP